MTLDDAEKIVAQTLANVERELDVVIDAVELNDIDVTKYQDTRIQMVRTVRIVCHRLPGHDWYPK